MPAAAATSLQPEPLSHRLWVGVFWFVLFCALVSYGANNTSALPIINLIIYLMLPVAFSLRGIPSAVRWPFKIALLLLSAITIFAILQALPLPGSLFANPIWADVSDLAPGLRPTISVTPGDVQFGLLKVALPFGIFLVSLIIFDTDARAMSALRFVAVAGATIALLSIAQFQLFPDTLIIDEKQYYLDSLTAPFVNRNTAGTFFGLISVIAVAMTARAVAKVDIQRILMSLETRRQTQQQKNIATAAFFTILSLISVAALFLTNSRGAAGSTFAALVVLVLIMSRAKPAISHSNGFERKNLFQGPWRVVGSLALIAMTAVVYGVLAGRVMLRAEVRGLEDGRFCVMPGIVSAIRDSWPLGTGLTSFRAIFPAYRDANCGIQYVWEKAHNGYAEGLLSLGIFFPAIAIILLGSLAIIYRCGLKTRKRLRFVSALGFATMTLISLHAAADFSLQIPGLAAFYAALTGPMVTICLQRTAGMRKKPRFPAEYVAGETAPIVGAHSVGTLRLFNR